MTLQHLGDNQRGCKFYIQVLYVILMNCILVVRFTKTKINICQMASYRYL